MEYRNQKERVLNYLKQHGSITTKECMNELEIMDLQKAIQLLRQDGEVIKDEWIHKTNKYGAKIKYKKYMIGE